MAARVFGGRGRSGDGPVVDLDFTRCDKVVSDLVGGSGANGTRMNAAGVLASVGWPRIDFNPVTLACLGLLAEETRTNKVPYSQDLTAGWTGAASAALAAESFLGFAPFYEVTKTTAVGSESRGIDCGSTVAGQSLTLTVAFLRAFVHATDDAEIGIYSSSDGWGFNADTTCRVLSGPGSVRQDAGSIWYVTNLSLTEPTVIEMVRATANTGDVAVLLYPGTASSTSIGHAVKATRFHLETGTASTSYIPTAGAAVTRAADVASLPAALGLINLSAGTLYVENSYSGGATWTPSNRVAASICAAGDYRAIIYNNSGSANGMYVQSPAGAGLFTSAGVADSAGATHKTAFAYNGQNEAVAAMDGAIVTRTATASMLSDADRIYIGCTVSGAGQLNGHIRRLAYWRRRLSDRELMEITRP